MALSIETVEFLNLVNETDSKPMHLSSVMDVRKSIASFVGLQNEKRKSCLVEDAFYKLNRKLRIYKPLSNDENFIFPVMVYYHGGGFISGDLEVGDDFCRTLCTENNTIVVAIDYGLAPENIYPVAHQDAKEGLDWVVKNIYKFNGNNDLTIVGDSVGGNLAVCTAMWAIEAGINVINQILISPILSENIEFDSKESDLEIMITIKDIKWFWKNYLGYDGKIMENINPFRMKNIKESPRTLIITMEHEIMRDSAEAYGILLKKNGVKVEVHRIPGVIHGIIWASRIFPENNLINQHINNFLKESYINSNQ